MNLATLLIPQSLILLAQVPNEVTWRNSIEADINNRAPASAICTSAMASAQTSKDVTFKNWAYEVSRRYCRNGSGPGPVVDSAQNGPTCPPITQQQQAQINAGKRVSVSGGNCQMIFNDKR